MNPRSFMLIAGEASGDLLAAELVEALRRELSDAEPVFTNDFQPLHTSLEPRFLGAGGPRMAAAGVKLALDMTAHSVTGISDALKNYSKFRRLFDDLFRLALEREPDAIICVDFSGFNRRFAQAIKRYVRPRSDWFHDWNPKLIQYVSPQVWASREGRAYQMARDYDLLLSIFPFEKDWYARRVPQFRVEFVGHPIVDRYAAAGTHAIASQNTSTQAVATGSPVDRAPLTLLLPGSRPDELRRHLPVIFGALSIMRASMPKLRARMVLPDETLLEQAKASGIPERLQLQAGGLADSLAEADLAIASTGTVTVECAWFDVPTIALYKTSWSTYQIAKRIMKVKYVAMPNLLADEEIFPEFIQDAATPENIARAAVELLRDENRRAQVKRRLAEITASLGPPGATRRAAGAIVRLLEPQRPILPQPALTV